MYSDTFVIATNNHFICINTGNVKQIMNQIWCNPDIPFVNGVVYFVH